LIVGVSKTRERSNPCSVSNAISSGGTRGQQKTALGFMRRGRAAPCDEEIQRPFTALAFSKSVGRQDRARLDPAPPRPAISSDPAAPTKKRRLKPFQRLRGAKRLQSSFLLD
jgi:hypothetical protein